VVVFFSSFWPTLPDPGHQTNEPVFLDTRLSSELLEPLIGFLAYLERIYRTKKQKIGEILHSHQG